METCCNIWIETAHTPLPSLVRFQNLLRFFEKNKLFPTPTTLFSQSKRHNKLTRSSLSPWKVLRRTPVLSRLRVSFTVKKREENKYLSF